MGAKIELGLRRSSGKEAGRHMGGYQSVWDEGSQSGYCGVKFTDFELCDFFWPPEAHTEQFQENASSPVWSLSPPELSWSQDHALTQPGNGALTCLGWSWHIQLSSCS